VCIYISGKGLSHLKITNLFLFSYSFKLVAQENGRIYIFINFMFLALQARRQQLIFHFIFFTLFTNSHNGLHLHHSNHINGKKAVVNITQNHPFVSSNSKFLKFAFFSFPIIKLITLYKVIIHF